MVPTSPSSIPIRAEPSSWVQGVDVSARPLWTDKHGYVLTSLLPGYRVRMQQSNYYSLDIWEEDLLNACSTRMSMSG